MLTNDKFPGAEALDSAGIALDSEPDINPGMDTVQAKVRAVSVGEDPGQARRVEKVVREQALPNFKQSFTDRRHDQERLEPAGDDRQVRRRLQDPHPD